MLLKRPNLDVCNEQVLKLHNIKPTKTNRTHEIEIAITTAIKILFSSLFISILFP